MVQATPEKLEQQRTQMNGLKKLSNIVDRMAVSLDAGQERSRDTGERIPDVRKLRPETAHALMKKRASEAIWTYDPGNVSRFGEMGATNEAFQTAATREHDEHAAAGSKRARSA